MKQKNKLWVEKEQQIAVPITKAREKKFNEGGASLNIFWQTMGIDEEIIFTYPD